MKSIVVFNNKGGVGKTTMLCNIAAFLKIKKNKRIIVVDADPQCNTTTYMFPYPEIEQIYSSSQKDSTVNKIVRNLDKYKTEYDVSSLIKTSPNFQVDIIPGDTKLSLSEDFLSKDWIDVIAGKHRGIQTNLIFKDLLYKLRDYDFVFFDVGPSLGALNRSILVACDYFVVPMSSDIFSIQALENISISIHKWKEEICNGLAMYRRNENESFKLNNEEVLWHLKFIGYIAQQYTAKTVDGQKRAVKAYEKIIRKIPESIEKYLLPLNDNDNRIPHIKLGEITNLSSLIPLSQNSNVPIFNLQASHGVVGAHFNKVKEYESILSDIVIKLMANL